MAGRAAVAQGARSRRRRRRLCSAVGVEGLVAPDRAHLRRRPRGRGRAARVPARASCRHEGYARGVLERSPADVYAEHCRRRGAGLPGRRRRVAPVVPPACRARRVARERGRGTVYATTVVRRAEARPRTSVLVDLDEGFRMMSRRGRRRAGGRARSGMRVRLAWRSGEASGTAARPGRRRSSDGTRDDIAIAGAAEAQIGQALPG